MTEKCKCGNDLISLIINEKKYLESVHTLHIICDKCEDRITKTILNQFFIAPPNDDKFIDYLEDEGNQTIIIARQK